MNDSSQPRAVFGTDKREIARVLFRAQAMYDGLVTNAAVFVTPTVTMVAFLALITALVTAQQQAQATKAIGATAVRNTKRNALWTAMESLQKYIQGLADGMRADDATVLIQSAGLLVAATPTRHKQLLAATLTTTPGVVHLVANVSLLAGKNKPAKKAMFHWEWSDDGGQTWNSVTSTLYASTDIPGLTQMRTYTFRVSATIGKTAGTWSNPVSLLVV